MREYLWRERETTPVFFYGQNTKHSVLFIYQFSESFEGVWGNFLKSFPTKKYYANKVYLQKFPHKKDYSKYNASALRKECALMLESVGMKREAAHLRQVTFTPSLRTSASYCLPLSAGSHLQ